MCQANFTSYPCSHATLTSFTPCAPRMHPQICNARNVSIHIKQYQAGSKTVPSICPGSKPTRACFNTPLLPSAYIEVCQTKQMTLEDAIALAPVWVYDLSGNKVGVRTKPWCLTDYVVAWYRAKSPTALQNRIRAAETSASTEARKRKADDGLDVAERKPKIEKRAPSDTTVVIDSVQVEAEGYDADSESDEVVVKAET